MANNTHATLSAPDMADPYDMIKRNGLDRDDELGFSTEYVDNVGFMACYIIAVPYIEAGDR